jgi:SAM-dependent methyltransferase
MNRWDLKYLLGITPWDMPRAHPALVEVVKRELVEPCGAIDLGCGTGGNARFLAERGFQVAGVDLSSRAIAIARRRSSTAPITFTVADLLEPDSFYDGEPFGFSIDLGTLHTMPPDLHPRFGAAVATVTGTGSHHLSFGVRPGRWTHRGKNRLAAVPPGITGSGLEATLAPHGFTLVAATDMFVGSDGLARAGWYLFRRR